MAAIPDAGGAQCAPHAVMLRALLRVVVLVGLVITGWLLGSGTGLANEDPGHKNLAKHTGLFGLVKAPPPDEGFSGPLGTPPVVVESTLRGLTRAAPVQRLVEQPPAHVPVVTPVLARVSEHVAAPVLVPVVKHATHAPAVTPRAVVDKPTPLAPVPLAGPVVEAGLAPAHASSTVAPPVDEVASATQVSTTTRPVASQFTGPPALGGAPAAPVPASPPGTTTAACPVGSSGGGGTTTKGAHFATLGDSGAMADLTPRHRLHTSSGSIPRSAAEQPTSSPD